MIMSITPGINVKIVLEVDHQSGRINARNSMVYHVSSDTLILAQTEPSISNSMLKKEIVVTYLVDQRDRRSRHGFSVVVTEVIDRYELMPQWDVRAFAVRRCGDPKPYDIRMCYRVGPSSKSGLDASVYNKKINVIDISLGGIRFSFDKDLQLEANQVIEVRLAMAGGVYPIQARIVRTWEVENERVKKDLSFAGAEFLNVSGKIEQELSRKILDIQRETPFTVSEAQSGMGR
jgi:hypothetical protein